jgi:hypothetical protein
MPSSLEVTTPKSVTCSICQKKFSRTDHLKRHQLRRESSLLWCGNKIEVPEKPDDKFKIAQNLLNELPILMHGNQHPHSSSVFHFSRLIKEIKPSVEVDFGLVVFFNRSNSFKKLSSHYPFIAVVLTLS